MRRPWRSTRTDPLLPYPALFRSCFGGVYNAIDEAAGFGAEAREGRRLGFDGKTLIHPSQVDPCNAAFAPSAREIAAAEALAAAATGGAQRHEGRMIEDMHVAAAREIGRAHV